MRVGRSPDASLVRFSALLNPFGIFAVCLLEVLDRFCRHWGFVFAGRRISMTKTLLAVDGWLLITCFLSRFVFLEFVAEIRSL